jgi:YesN/AraC family two-component response regulator
MPKILIIEDEAAISTSTFQNTSSEENDNITWLEDVEDGAAGYEKIKNNDYDLVLCDIKMPNGWC